MTGDRMTWRENCYRYGTLLFGLVGGVTIVAMVGRYGYVGADTEIDGRFAAMFFGLIAIGALCGHAVGVAVWRMNRLAGFAVHIVATVALGVNLSNSLGALAARDARTMAERSEATRQHKELGSEIKRLQEVRAAIPAHTPTTTEAVNAAKSAVDAAVRSREQECKRLGDNCRLRIDEETVARNSHSAAITNAALTAKAAEIERHIATAQGKLEKLGAIEPPSALASALARMFSLPDTQALTFAAWQRMAVAIMLELLVPVAFVGFEVMRVAEKRPADPLPTPSVAPLPVITPSAVVRPMFGAVPDFINLRLIKQTGRTVEIAALVRAYEEWCLKSGQRPLERPMLMKELDTHLPRAGIGIEFVGERPVAYGVKLAA